VDEFTQEELAAQQQPETPLAAAS